GRVEEFLATGEAGDPHTKPFFFPVVSAATCTDNHLEVDQRLPMAIDSSALASAAAGASSDRAVALPTGAAAWSATTGASACTDSSRTTTDSELLSYLFLDFLGFANYGLTLSHRSEPFLLLCCEELGSIAPDAAGNNKCCHGF
ncbi:hypothetical protein Taro_041931, partial [Colocasia esculenta]|nr:hypothetical protein [Colocasia esculenta]